MVSVTALRVWLPDTGLVLMHFNILLFELLLSQKGYYRAMPLDFVKFINKGSSF